MLPGKSPYALQERVRNIYYDEVIPCLDKLFSGLTGDGVIIRIDRLDLDLGSVAADSLEEELTEKVLSAMKKALEGKLRFDVADSGGVDVIPLKVSAMDTLFYFLGEGHLPWWSSVENISSLEAVIQEGRTLPERYRVHFRKLVEKGGVELERLFFQCSEIFLWWLCEQCFPAADGAYEDGKDGMTKSVRQDRERRKDDANMSADMRAMFILKARRYGIFKDKRAAAAAETGGAAVVEYHRDDIAGEERGREVRIDGEADAIPAAGDQREGPVEEMPADGDRRDRAVGTVSVVEDGGEETVKEIPVDEKVAPSVMSVKGATGGELIDDHASGLQGTERQRKGKSLQDDDEALYPGLTGLVLLHPFISPFFDGVRLLEGKSFRDEEARHKAVHLLGYLATGEEEIEEPLLMFPKVLCGMELDRPIRKRGNLTQEEREEAGQLLSAVTGYWKGLKSSSTGALREYFLQRNGKLSRKEEGWHLDVEKKTWDILLGSLPWGYSIIKFPWMKEMIFVNWG